MTRELRDSLTHSPMAKPLLLSLTILTFFSHIHASDLDTLLSFKAAIEDPKSSLATWSKSSNTHFCNWTGIACTANNTVASISLQSSNLSGEISPSVCELLSLSSLDLADNLFNQPIPLHLSGCKSLEALNLSNNLIWGTIPDQISGFSSLKVLDLSKNHVEGKIPDGIGLLKKLRVLNLASNLLSGNVPKIFGNLTELVVLDLSQNSYLASEIPSGLGELARLEQLLLQKSGFYGQIPDSLLGLQSLVVLDLSQNNLTGKVPQSSSSSLKSLVSFDVSENSLSGSFPDGICRNNGVQSLSLHTNLFNGPISSSISECLSLERFQVQNNLFSGDFPAGLWSLPKIKLIRAENNLFSGPIPESIAKASQLEQVQIDNNSFTGEIPQGLGHVKSLYRFSAPLNGFSGEIPPNFCDSPVLSIVNLSHNSLSGQIPELKQCRKLVSLSMAGNNLAGKIPPSLADLPVLTYLDLSNNNLSGSIPQGLQNLKLALLNVSFNRLSGRVPYSLISGLPASFLQGNPGLCGPGLPNSCSEDEPVTDRDNVGLTTLACALISLAFAVGTMLVVAGFILYRRSRGPKSEFGSWRSVFFYPLRVTEHDLITGMDEKSAAGSGSPLGRVYILSLPSGERIAVKKLGNFEPRSSKSLKAEIKTLAKIRHRNIAKVLGFFHSEDAVYLIYEFLPNRSLAECIGRANFELNWGRRVRIAVGVAQGLAYLHKDYVPHLLHRNVKSSNILLDDDFEPKLTDFALDRVVGESAFRSAIATESPASCYNPPEFGYTKKPGEPMDVYSFGVVLLELVTGRPAGQSDSSGSVDIVKRVRRKVNISNGVFQVLDPKMPVSVQQEMLGALEVALRCTSVMPEKRPAMTEVVKSLQSLGSRTNLPIVEFSSSFEENSAPV